jgi:hypothetical protein
MPDGRAGGAARVRPCEQPALPAGTEIVALAGDLLAWTAMLALTGPARRWEPKRLRLRLFSAAGRIARPSRR